MVINMTPNCPFCGCPLDLQEMASGGVCRVCDPELEGKKRVVAGRTYSTDDLPLPELDENGCPVDSEPID